MKLKKLGDRKFKTIKEKLRQLEYLMRYERPREGIYKFSPCEHCQEGVTRTGRCYDCLRKEHNRCRLALKKYQWPREKNGKKRL